METDELIILWSGGFSSSGAAWVTFEVVGLSSHSFVIVERSRLPLKHSSGRLSFTTDGLWISEYSLVASRPAYFRMTY